MKFLLAVLFSLVLHGWLVQWQWAEELLESDSSGRAALAIARMSVIKNPPHLQPVVEQAVVKKKAIVERSLVAAAVEVKPDLVKDLVPALESEPDKSPELEELEVVEQIEAQPEEIELDQVDDVKPVEVVTTTELESEYVGFSEIPVMEQPRYRKAFPPKYPRLARRRGQQGVVFVKAKVGVDGMVETVELLKSSGYQSLDSSALKAVAQWQFHPHRINEQLSVAWVEVPVEFTFNR